MSDRSLTPEILLSAYAAGVFPMGETRDDPEVFWVDPPMRGVLPLDGFHLSRSLSRRMRSGAYHVTLNQNFGDIINGCADRNETWINSTILILMTSLHQMERAHAFGVWKGGRLIGGIYGLDLGSAFIGESMFSRESDGSKLALAWAVDHLSRTGFTLFDTQFLTPHLATLGGVEISRDTYRARLANALENQNRASISSLPLETDPYAVVQRISHTSYLG